MRNEFRSATHGRSRHPHAAFRLSSNKIRRDKHSLDDGVDGREQERHLLQHLQTKATSTVNGRTVTQHTAVTH